MSKKAVVLLMYKNTSFTIENTRFLALKIFLFTEFEEPKDPIRIVQS